MAESHESRQFCLRGYFIFILVLEKEPGAAAPRTAEDLFAAPGLKLAQRERGLAFTVPWKKKHTRILAETSSHLFGFSFSSFRLHPGLRGDLSKLKGRPGSQEGYGATGT